LPFTASAELIAVIVAASRLLLLRNVGGEWESFTAQDLINFSIHLADLSESFHQARQLEQQRSAGNKLGISIPLNGSKDPFTRYIEKIVFVKTWFERRIAAQGEIGLAPTMDDTGGLAASLAENGDNQFWLGLLGNDAWNF
jgi:hypothetical protein